MSILSIVIFKEVSTDYRRVFPQTAVGSSVGSYVQSICVIAEPLRLVLQHYNISTICSVCSISFHIDKYLLYDIYYVCAPPRSSQ